MMPCMCIFTCQRPYPCARHSKLQTYKYCFKYNSFSLCSLCAKYILKYYKKKSCYMYSKTLFLSYYHDSFNPVRPTASNNQQKIILVFIKKLFKPFDEIH